MTTSIHLCLGPCVGLVALLSLLRSTVQHHLFDTQLSDSTDYLTVHGLSDCEAVHTVGRTISVRTVLYP